MTDSLIAGTTPDTGSQQTDAAATVDATATTDTTASPQQNATDAATTDTTATTQDDSSDKTTETDKPAGAPEKYEFKPVEGAELAPEVTAKFEGIARELGLTQDAAQKVLDTMAPEIAAAQAKAIETVKAEWTETSKTDKEFGGEKLEANLAVAKKALDTFGTPELKQLLVDSGLGNHPEIIRAFYRAGLKITPPKVVSGSGGPTGSQSAADTLYPNQKSA